MLRAFWYLWLSFMKVYYRFGENYILIFEAVKNWSQVFGEVDEWSQSDSKVALESKFPILILLFVKVFYYLLAIQTWTCYLHIIYSSVP